jgi:nitroreductase
MELHQAIYQRRAVRDYHNSVSDHLVIDRLIDAAIQAPAALNQQPWIFAVVRNQRVFDGLSGQTKTSMLSEIVGGDGIITVEESKSTETSLEASSDSTHSKLDQGDVYENGCGTSSLRRRRTAMEQF